MLTDMSMELSAFSPGSRPASDDPEEVDLSQNNDQLKPIMDKLQGFEQIVSKVTKGNCETLPDAVIPSSYLTDYRLVAGARICDLSC